MVQMSVSFSSFHNWRSTVTMGKSLFNKSMPLYFLLYTSSVLIKPSVSVSPKLSSTMVVLKSPFHYKGPKHHIQYKFFTMTISSSVSPEFSDKVYSMLTSYFHQNKPHSAMLSSKSVLTLPQL